MFRHLRTRLTVLYAGLFVAALAAIALAVYAASAANAERLGRDQLAASGVVFDRLLATRMEALEDEAALQARDFGFQSAIATHDSATVRSALGNLASRLNLNMAFVVDPQGQVTGQDPALDGQLPAEVVRAVRASDDPVSGLFRVGGKTYEGLAAPIRMPATAGWVLFAKALGKADMTQLERLSAIPLQATVVSRAAAGGWTSLDTVHPLATNPRLLSLLDRASALSRPERLDFSDRAGASLVFAHRLQGLGDSGETLLLRYPLADAMKPFNGLFRGIVVIGLGGVLLLILGSWVIASTLTGPLSTLGGVARRLQAGESDARAPLAGGDEIAALGSAFNAMADAIAEREASLLTAKERAEAADRVKGEFLANMNHELRTPLNGVLGCASVLVGTPLSPDQQRMVELIQSSGQGLQRIVDSVLDLVELSAGEIRLVETPFDLGAVVAAVAAEAKRGTAAKGLGFELQGDLAENLWVRGDGRRVTQVLSSLLDNAVKFTDRGTVRLAVSRDGPAWRLQVRDTGVGFDSKDAEALFHPFRQADGSMTRRFGGVGLGLSLARDLARAMGGEVEADGRVGEGASFTFTAPLAAVEAPIAVAPPVSAEAVEAEGEDYPPVRILLAEDNPANRAVVELILGAAGVDLVSVENGAEAVDAFAAQPFDLVLMDLQMPVMDGLTAIRLIREGEPDAARTPIIVLSANVQAEHVEASAAAGADMHLAKPIVAATLLGALEQALAAA